MCFYFGYQRVHKFVQGTTKYGVFQISEVQKNIKECR